MYSLYTSIKGQTVQIIKIVGLIKKGDFLITQDYGLASLVLPKGVRVFHQSGKEFDTTNIDGLLEQRYQKQ